MVRTEMMEDIEIDKGVTDLVKCDKVLNRINAYLSAPPLNIEKDDYCYVRVVRNHLEIGRAKIELEE